MSAESPRKAYKYTCNMVRPQPYSEKSLMESVVDFFNDVVPQAYTGCSRIDDKEKIQWVRFEDCDCNDISKNPDLFKADTKGLPLLLILGYSNGVQIWYITPNGEAQEIMSIRQGPVRLFRVLPTPDPVFGYSDTYSLKRPLAVMCDSSSAGQPYCSIKFISLKTGDELHSINYKTLTVQNVECNKRFLVTVFYEKMCVYETCQFKQLFWITSCYPCPGPKVNPIALSTRWLAYADKRLVPMHQSCGGMSGDGSQSYAATVISAAKGCFKGLSMFSEAMGSYVTGNKSYTSKKVDVGVVDNGDRPGIISVLDLQNIHSEHFNVNEDNDGDGLIAHFHAHANEPVSNMAFDSSGTLLVTACKLGHNFHIFRLMAHPCNSSLGAVHHLYTLHRGDTTAKVIDISFNHDSRWVTVSTHRGTTHLFPITPYGGAVSVRTHCQPHVVNRASRFHKSAGLDEIEHNPVGRRSPVLSSSPGSSGQYDRYPSLIQQNTLNNNMGNPRLPPYPHPITVYPAYQIKQPLNISMNPGNKNSSPTHSPTGIDNIFSVASMFSSPRMCVVGSPKLGIERRESGKRPVDSLFILAQSGTLVEYVLEPRARLSGDKITDESQLELGVTGRMQWNLQRLKNSPEQRPPLPSNSPLILAREAVASQVPTAPDLFDLPGLTRQESKESLSSDHSGKDESDEQWLSQVEIITHAGPHRRLWMGPQFSFKTYQNTTVLSSSSSALLSQSPESGLAAMDIAGDEGDLESLKVQPARSNPVSMPTARPAYRRLSGSDSSPTPSKGAHSAPLMIEAGSYDQSPHLCDVYSTWVESTVAKQPHLNDELEEDQLKETLADAMVESPIKDSGKGMVKQEITRSETSSEELQKGAAENLDERLDKKKEKGKKKKGSLMKNDKQTESKEISVEAIDGAENQKMIEKKDNLRENGSRPKDRNKKEIGKNEKQEEGLANNVEKALLDTSSSPRQKNQEEVILSKIATDMKAEKDNVKSKQSTQMQASMAASNVKLSENETEKSRNGKKKNRKGKKSPNENEQKQHDASPPKVLGNRDLKSGSKSVDKESSHEYLKGVGPQDLISPEDEIYEEAEEVSKETVECKSQRKVHVDSAELSDKSTYQDSKSEFEICEQNQGEDFIDANQAADVKALPSLDKDKHRKVSKLKEMSHLEKVDLDIRGCRSTSPDSHEKTHSFSQADTQGNEEDVSSVTNEQPKSLLESNNRCKKEGKNSTDTESAGSVETDSVENISRVQMFGTKSDCVENKERKYEILDLKLGTDDEIEASSEQIPGDLSVTNANIKIGSDTEKMKIKIVDAEKESCNLQVNKILQQKADITDKSISSEVMVNRKEIKKDVSEMEESMMAESMMEMSITDLPSKPTSDGSIAQGGKDDDFKVAGGKNKKKKRKNKKTADGGI